VRDESKPKLFDFQTSVEYLEETVWTSYETLDRAYNIAKDAGLYYIYVGNIQHEHGGNTFCPNCNHLILGRAGYRFTKIDVSEEKSCPKCGYSLKNDIIGEINKKPSNHFAFF